VSRPPAGASDWKDRTVQYLLSIYQPDGPAPAPEVLGPIMRDVARVTEEMQAAGAWVFSTGLSPAEQAIVFHRQDGEVLVTDGPFTEAKEHLGGFTMIEAPDLDAARGWASKLAAALGIPVELRAVQEVPRG
jgi:hypothetical protein